MLKALFDDFGLCERISATSSAESFVRSASVGWSQQVGWSQSVGCLRGGKAACWKLSLAILDSATVESWLDERGHSLVR